MQENPDVRNEGGCAQDKHVGEQAHFCWDGARQSVTRELPACIKITFQPEPPEPDITCDMPTLFVNPLNERLEGSDVAALMYSSRAQQGLCSTSLCKVKIG